MATGRDVQEMLSDRQMQEHIDKVCRYQVEEKHLAVRAYSPLTMWSARATQGPVRSRLPFKYLTHLWVLADFSEQVAHLSDGWWTLEPMPYLWQEINDQYQGPNRPPHLAGI